MIRVRNEGIPYSFRTSSRQRGNYLAHEVPEVSLFSQKYYSIVVTFGTVVRRTRVRIPPMTSLFRKRNFGKEVSSGLERIIRVRGSRGRTRKLEESP